MRRTEMIYTSCLACCQAYVALATEVQICLSEASEMTVDREGDGRIGEGLESLGGR